MNRRHSLQSLVVLLAGLAMALGTLAYVRASGTRRVRQQFDRAVAVVAGDLEREVATGEDVLVGVRGFFCASEEVTADEFRRYALECLRRHPEVHGVAWAPRVRQAGRAAHEADAVAAGAAGYHVREPGPAGVLVPAAVRDEYLPVRYVQEREGAAAALGLDLAADGQRRGALQAAAERDSVVGMEAPGLLLAGGRGGGLLLALPVFDGERQDGPGRREGLLGYVLVAYHVRELVEKVLLDPRAPPLEMSLEVLRQEREDEPGTPLHVHPSAQEVDDSLQVHRPLRMPEGVRWAVLARPTRRLVEQTRFDPYGYGLATLLAVATLAALGFQRMLALRSQENERLSRTDPLTGVANRRALMEHLEREWARCLRARLPLGLVMGDVDGFKAYNDLRGHIEGDRCLREVAEALRRSVLRPADLVSRFGGDEFVIVLPETDAGALRTVTERIRAHVAALGIPAADGGGALRLTLGECSLLPTAETSVTDLLQRADAALYRAKAARRQPA